MANRAFSTVQLVNGSIGDPVLYLDYPGLDNAMLFDAGDNAGLTMAQLADLEAVFISHHHVDHFIGFDRIIRANIDREKQLHVYGPRHTISKVYDRIMSYEYPFFPFQQIAIVVHELDVGVRRRALLECTKKFPVPEVTEEPWSGPVCYENDFLQIHAAPTDHTVAGWAYALVEKPGIQLCPERLEQGLLRPGRWIPEALARLRAQAPLQELLEIQGGRYTLETLQRDYFAESPGARVAFIVDTLWSESVQAGLTELCRGAWRLYCDSFYAKKQAKSAAKHKHMMAHQAAELAKRAKVQELILIHFSTRYRGQYDQLLAEAQQIFSNTTMQLG